MAGGHAGPTGRGPAVIRKALLFMISLAAAWLIASQRQDIARYLKIKQMSMGSGHPQSAEAAGQQTEAGQD